MLMRMLCRSAVVKTELNVKARLLIYTVTLTYAHEVKKNDTVDTSG